MRGTLSVTSKSTSNLVEQSVVGGSGNFATEHLRAVSMIERTDRQKGRASASEPTIYSIGQALLIRDTVITMRFTV